MWQARAMEAALQLVRQTHNEHRKATTKGKSL